MLRKRCPGCGKLIAIWHATIYRTFAPDELTEEKLKELEQWIKEVVEPGLAKILDKFEEEHPNVCPHCEAKLMYENWPVKKVKLYELRQ